MTGGAGFVGSAVCDKWIKDGHTIFCLDNLSNGNLNNVRHLLSNRNFKFIKGDVCDKDLVEQLVQKVNVVVHLAAQIHTDRSLSEPELTLKSNILGTLNLLEASRFNDVDKFIYASSSEIYGTAKTFPMNEDHPMSPPHCYGVSKLAADRLCWSFVQTYGMPINICRNFNLFGERQKDSGYGGVVGIFTRRVLNGLAPQIFGNGKQTRDYMYISDGVAAYDSLLNTKIWGEVFNFGTGVNLSINEIAKAVIKECGSSVNPVYVEPRANEVFDLVCDYSKAKELLDWKPQVSFKEGLYRYVHWFRNHRSEEWKLS